MTWDKPGRDKILWVDLETTGSGDDDFILEIGALMTDHEMNEIDSKQIVLPITAAMEEGLVPVVREMHTVSGLLEDCRSKVLEAGESMFILPEQMLYANALAIADAELADWVREYNGTNHMPWAGSGILHYDRKYIKRDLPKFNARITYWGLDVGVIRRALELADIQLTVNPTGGTDAKTHRGLDDARVHAAEMRRFLSWARGF